MEVDAQNDKNGNVDDWVMITPHLQVGSMRPASRSIGHQFMLPNINEMSKEFALTKRREISQSRTAQGLFGISTSIIPVGSEQHPSTMAQATSKR